MELDFKNDFTASLATVLFWIMMVTAALWLFVEAYTTGHSFGGAVFAFLMFAPFFMGAAGIVFAPLSFTAAILVNLIRKWLQRPIPSHTVL